MSNICKVAFCGKKHTQRGYCNRHFHMFGRDGALKKSMNVNAEYELPRENPLPEIMIDEVYNVLRDNGFLKSVPVRNMVIIKRLFELQRERGGMFSKLYVVLAEEFEVTEEFIIAVVRKNGMERIARNEWKNLLRNKFGFLKSL